MGFAFAAFSVLRGQSSVRVVDDDIFHVRTSTTGVKSEP